MPKDNCEIVFATNERNGNPRYWCRTHFANATGVGGTKLEKCRKASDLPPADNEKLVLDPNSFQGGVAIWGALRPVYSTVQIDEKPGVHVHARECSEELSPKTIDDTYKEVSLKVGVDLFGGRWEKISEAAAVSYFNTLSAGYTPQAIICSHCKRLHLDEDTFSVFPHRKHQCQYCGRDFFEEDLGIGNPIAAIKAVFNDLEFERSVENSTDSFEQCQRDFKGGVQIWASNPAAFWTQPKPESEGIHFHGYDATGKRVVDETFGKFSLDGVKMGKSSMRLYMAQMQVSGLSSKVHTLYCPNCNAPHFDKSNLAFKPHIEHECEICGNNFNVAGEKVIGNPIVEQLDRLRKIYESDIP